MRAYPHQLRAAVLAARDAGKSARDVAKEFGVSESWVRRVKQRRGQIPLPSWPRMRRRTPNWAAYADQIEALMEKNEEMKLRELQEALDTDLSLSTLCRALQKLNWSKRYPKAYLDEIYDRIDARERAQSGAERFRRSRQEFGDCIWPFQNVPYPHSF